jgi:hypothetical protein
VDLKPDDGGEVTDLGGLCGHYRRIRTLALKRNGPVDAGPPREPLGSWRGTGRESRPTPITNGVNV